MSEHVNPVHQQYMDLSSRYKAGWTFHRFIQGLRKFFGGEELHDHTAVFQELYAELREASKHLNDPVIKPVVDELAELGGRLDEVLEALDGEDGRINPSLVRLFFRRIKTYDERLLLDLVRFYIEIQRGKPWESERVDKVDFLLSRLAEAVAGQEVGRDRTRLARVLGNLSEQWASEVEGDEIRISNRRRMIEGVQKEIRELESFEDLTKRDLVGHYRQIKHGLGGLLFEKSILPIIVDTNLALSDCIRALSQDEERHILEDYEKISRLEQGGGVDRDLADSVNQLHLQVSHFRKQIDKGSIRLHDMARIRRSVLQILERIERPEEGGDEVATNAGVRHESPRLAARMAIPLKNERLLIGQTYENLIEVLLQTDQGSHAERRVAAQAHTYRLEERELMSFDRLLSGDECDEDFERFVLASAALRHRINEELTAIQAERRQPGTGTQVSAETTAILRLADAHLRRFAHFLDAGLTQAGGTDLKELQLLRMRLMRDYSGLWLISNSSS